MRHGLQTKYYLRALVPVVVGPIHLSTVSKRVIPTDTAIGRRRPLLLREAIEAIENLHARMWMSHVASEAETSV